jgi:hypothetical protein
VPSFSCTKAIIFTATTRASQTYAYSNAISSLHRLHRSFGHLSGYDDPMADQPDKILHCSLKESNKYQVVVIPVTGT